MTMGGPTRQRLVAASRRPRRRAVAKDDSPKHLVDDWPSMAVAPGSSSLIPASSMVVDLTMTVRLDPDTLRVMVLTIFFV
jgi:hypothetical protein